MAVTCTHVVDVTVPMKANGTDELVLVSDTDTKMTGWLYALLTSDH